MHNDGDSDIGAMFDGTWQKRGYSSLNGVIVASKSWTQSVSVSIVLFVKESM